MHITVPARHRKLWHVYIHVYKCVLLVPGGSILIRTCIWDIHTYFMNGRIVHDSTVAEDVLPRLLNSKLLRRCPFSGVYIQYSTYPLAPVVYMLGGEHKEGYGRCIYLCKYLYIYTYTYTYYIYIYMYIHTHTYIHACIHIYIYIHMCIYIYIYTHL